MTVEDLELSESQVIRVDPGDVLIVIFAKHMSDRQCQAVADSIAPVVGRKVIVLQDGAKLEKYERRARREPWTAPSVAVRNVGGEQDEGFCAGDEGGDEE